MAYRPVAFLLENLVNTKQIALGLPLFLFTFTADAATCKDLKSCATVMYDLLGQRYIWEASSEKQIVTSPDIELTKENAELVFTALLDQSLLARAPVGDGKTFRIVSSALRKEMPLPIVDASADLAPKLPNTWDIVAMRYKTKSRDLTTTIESAYRLHLPRESRLQADYSAGLLIVEATAPMVRHMYDMIKAADVPQTPEVKAYLKEQERKWEAIRARAEKK